MRDQGLTRKALSKAEQFFAILALALIGAFVGLIARMLSGPVTILPISDLMIDVGPAIFIGAVVGALFAYKFPRVASVVACFLPSGCELS
ncbi:MAG: hypothetical protein KDI68_08170 [Gammaproteobacteria bacterium]|nr:hypothetical protein [Gammaproteobacteria bacterium]